MLLQRTNNSSRMNTSPPPSSNGVDFSPGPERCSGFFLAGTVAARQPSSAAARAARTITPPGQGKSSGAPLPRQAGTGERFAAWFSGWCPSQRDHECHANRLAVAGPGTSRKVLEDGLDARRGRAYQKGGKPQGLPQAFHIGASSIQSANGGIGTFEPTNIAMHHSFL